MSYWMPLTPSRPVRFELQYYSPKHLQGVPVQYLFANLRNLFSIIQSSKSLLENFNYLRSQNRCLGNTTQHHDSYLHLPAHFSNPLHATLAVMSFKPDFFSSVPWTLNQDTERTVIKHYGEISSGPYHHFVILQMFINKTFILVFLENKFHYSVSHHLYHRKQITTSNTKPLLNCI